MEYVIFGASLFGKKVYEMYKNKYNIKYFCDNAKEKQGKLFLELQVIRPELIGSKSVIIASIYNIEIANQLIEMGVKRFFVAFVDRENNLKIQSIDLNDYEKTNHNNKKVCLICENNSGSNTLAISKLVKKSSYEFIVIYERNKDASYYYHLFTSRVIIKTHGGTNLHGYINIEAWHGIGLKPLGYMNRFNDEYAEDRHMNWNKLDAVFSYSQMYNLILSACYGVPINKFYVTGAPRNDFLFISDGRNILSEILPIGVHKKLILYAPTFRETVFGVVNGSSEAYLYNLEDINLYELDAYLSKNNCQIVMKLHPYDIDKGHQQIKNLNNVFILDDSLLNNNNLDFYEVLNAFDILITDYSSIYSDFLLLDRPIIFMPVDLSIYEQERGLLFEPYDFWTPGEKAVNTKELYNALKKILAGKDEFKSKRNEIKSIFHKFDDGKSTDRVLLSLEKLMEKSTDI